MSAQEVKSRIESLASEEVATTSARFFKTGPGEYGEGDIFVGVRVPVLRTLAREYKGLPLDEVTVLLRSPVHEERLFALLVLVLGLGKCSDEHRQTVYELYLNNTAYINNWDLVDTSAPTIVGGYLNDRSRKPLTQLAKSESLWERRIAIIATQHFIRKDDFDETLKISRMLIKDKEDLIHKATGWMLREVGDRDETRLHEFLSDHAHEMPRTALRYAIEKLPPNVRKTYLGAKGKK